MFTNLNYFVSKLFFFPFKQSNNFHCLCLKGGGHEAQVMCSSFHVVLSTEPERRGGGRDGTGGGGEERGRGGGRGEWMHRRVVEGLLELETGFPLRGALEYIHSNKIISLV